MQLNLKSLFEAEVPLFSHGTKNADKLDPIQGSLEDFVEEFSKCFPTECIQWAQTVAETCEASEIELFDLTTYTRSLPASAQPNGLGTQLGLVMTCIAALFRSEVNSEAENKLLDMYEQILKTLSYGLSRELDDDTKNAIFTDTIPLIRHSLRGVPLEDSSVALLLLQIVLEHSPKKVILEGFADLVVSALAGPSHKWDSGGASQPRTLQAFNASLCYKQSAKGMDILWRHYAIQVTKIAQYIADAFDRKDNEMEASRLLLDSNLVSAVLSLMSSLDRYYGHYLSHQLKQGDLSRRDSSRLAHVSRVVASLLMLGASIASWTLRQHVSLQSRLDVERGLYGRSREKSLGRCLMSPSGCAEVGSSEKEPAEKERVASSNPERARKTLFMDCKETSSSRQQQELVADDVSDMEVSLKLQVQAVTLLKAMSSLLGVTQVLLHGDLFEVLLQKNATGDRANPESDGLDLSSSAIRFQRERKQLVKRYELLTQKAGDESMSAHRPNSVGLDQRTTVLIESRSVREILLACWSGLDDVWREWRNVPLRFHGKESQPTKATTQAWVRRRGSTSGTRTSAQPKQKRLKLTTLTHSRSKSSNPFIEAALAEPADGDADDDYDDLADFIVCKPGKDYSEYLTQHNRRKASAASNPDLTPRTISARKQDLGLDVTERAAFVDGRSGLVREKDSGSLRDDSVSSGSAGSEASEDLPDESSWRALLAQF
eukprot:scaffold1204_cov407-Prasinococcus_capsulatus_cf.AAC.19